MTRRLRGMPSGDSIDQTAGVISFTPRSGCNSLRPPPSVCVGDEWSVQFLPEVGCNLGNVRTDFHAGGTLRVATTSERVRVERSHGGGPRCSSVRGLSGQAVLLDISSTNNFRDGPHVNKQRSLRGTLWCRVHFAALELTSRISIARSSSMDKKSATAHVRRARDEVLEKAALFRLDLNRVRHRHERHFTAARSGARVFSVSAAI